MRRLRKFIRKNRGLKREIGEKIREEIRDKMSTRMKIKLDTRRSARMVTIIREKMIEKITPIQKEDITNLKTEENTIINTAAMNMTPILMKKKITEAKEDTAKGVTEMTITITSISKEITIVRENMIMMRKTIIGIGKMRGDQRSIRIESKFINLKENLKIENMTITINNLIKEKNIIRKSHHLMLENTATIKIITNRISIKFEINKITEISERKTNLLRTNQRKL